MWIVALRCFFLVEKVLFLGMWDQIYYYVTLSSLSLQLQINKLEKIHLRLVKWVENEKFMLIEFSALNHWLLYLFCSFHITWPQDQQQLWPKLILQVKYQHLKLLQFSIHNFFSLINFFPQQEFFFYPANNFQNKPFHFYPTSQFFLSQIKLLHRNYKIFFFHQTKKKRAS